MLAQIINPFVPRILFEIPCILNIQHLPLCIINARRHIWNLLLDSWLFLCAAGKRTCKWETSKSNCLEAHGATQPAFCSAQKKKKKNQRITLLDFVCNNLGLPNFL